jgi:hypothetical protein
MDLDPLAQARVYEFLLVGLAIRFVGATGSRLHPIASCGAGLSDLYSRLTTNCGGLTGQNAHTRG